MKDILGWLIIEDCVVEGWFGPCPFCGSNVKAEINPENTIAQAECRNDDCGATIKVEGGGAWESVQRRWMQADDRSFARESSAFQNGKVLGMSLAPRSK